MDSATNPLISALIERVNSLTKERGQLLARIGEIDAQLGSMAKAANLDWMALHKAPDPISAPVADKRVAGSLPERIMTILRDETDVPLTRVMLKKLLLDDPRFSPTIQKSENTFYNAVLRYIRSGKIREIDGFLYHPDRAPLPSGEVDATGRRLPANVTPLFSQENGG